MPILSLQCSFIAAPCPFTEGSSKLLIAQKGKVSAKKSVTALFLLFKEDVEEGEGSKMKVQIRRTVAKSISEKAAKQVGGVNEKQSHSPFDSASHSFFNSH